MNLVKQHWDKVKNDIKIIEPYTLNETINILKYQDYYKTLLGKARNRTLIRDNIRLYKSIYFYSIKLEEIFINQNSYKSTYNFAKRILFLVEYNSDTEKLKCECGKKYSWTKYCRICPEPKRNNLNKTHKQSTKLKMRISALEYISSLKGRVVPRYNKESISIIEKYGKENGYKFIHAENGGEYFIKELGYFLDAYDPINNIVLEIDERFHFDNNGNLKQKDIERQENIQNLLNCKFIRIKYDKYS
jgi:hypothetical protein